MISLLCGVFSFLVLLFAIPRYLSIAVLFSALSALGLMIAIPFVMLLDARKYRDMEKSIEGNILAKAKVNTRGADTVRNGYLVLTADCLYVILRDKKPYLHESLPRIHSTIHFDGLTNLFIKTADDAYSLVSGEFKAFVPAMMECGWTLL